MTTVGTDTTFTSTGIATSGHAARAVTPGELTAADLLAGADSLAARLASALRDRQWLDAFLLAAGLGQLVEDRLHDDPFMLHRAASYLRGLPSRPARAAGVLTAAAGTALRLRPRAGRRRLRRARRGLAELTEQLAGQVLVPSQQARPVPVPPAVGPALRALAGDVLRLPTCFHSFDQHPDDIRWLVRALGQRYPVSETPLCVVGVRTSGSYLAPLYAAALRASGNPRVGVLTYRPGRPFLRWERSALKAVGRAGGLVLVADDPPGAGTALATTARAISAAGLPDSRIVFLLSVFGTASELPALLARWPAVVQPWADWSIHRRLTSDSVRQALTKLVSEDFEVDEVRQLGLLGTGTDRGHVRARFAVRLSDRRAGARIGRQILVEGAGLGYLGRQAVVVARALPGYLPHVYGFADGMLYRDWLPPGPDPGPDEALAETVAGYVAARRRALPAASGNVDQMGGRDPAWEVAARLLSHQYGRLSVPARPLLLDPLVRRLLSHDDPTVLDGKTDCRHWLPGPPEAGGLRKADFYQRTFGHLDLACYDPVCDLAGAAADPPAPDFERRLREAYQRASGQRVDPERWLLYRLAQLWRLGRACDLRPEEVRQRSGAAIHDYLADRYLRGLPPGQGPLCAIDLDGVLECDGLGYPATSPTGILALRALIAHGYRPALASGRSLPEVRDRVIAFGLAGGVAEYGAAIFHEGEVIDLRPPGAGDLLRRIRDELEERDGVEIDARYRYVVRARAGRGPLPAGLLSSVRAAADPAVRMIHGQGQTDITVTGTDKGSGLRALAARLGDPGCALAVGDSPPDLPLFALAVTARAPRNARLPAGVTNVKLTRHAFQAGLSDACADLLGHRPGCCPACRLPAAAPRTRVVLAVLDLRANGLASLRAGTVALGALLMRKSRL